MSPGFNPSNEPETAKKHRFPDPRSEFSCQSLQRSESDLPARAGEKLPAEGITHARWLRWREPPRSLSLSLPALSL